MSYTDARRFILSILAVEAHRFVDTAANHCDSCGASRRHIVHDTDLLLDPHTTKQLASLTADGK